MYNSTSIEKTKFSKGEGEHLSEGSGNLGVNSMEALLEEVAVKLGFEG